jgi:hypothetical protein
MPAEGSKKKAHLQCAGLESESMSSAATSSAATSLAATGNTDEAAEKEKTGMSDPLHHYNHQ